MSEHDTFHVVEFTPGNYWCGGGSTNGKIRPGSVGTPLLATRVDPRFANLALFQESFPGCRFAQVSVTYTVE